MAVMNRNLCVQITQGVLLIFLGGLGGCATPKLIAQTKVADTPENREVLRIVEQYRMAMEGRDPANILALVHPSYHDDSGTPEPEDDLDFAAMVNLLGTRFKKTKKVYYRMEYQAVHVKGREATVVVYLSGTFVYQTEGNPDIWKRFSDVNRFHLIKEGPSWRFIGGL